MGSFLTNPWRRVGLGLALYAVVVLSAALALLDHSDHLHDVHADWLQTVMHARQETLETHAILRHALAKGEADVLERIRTRLAATAPRLQTVAPLRDTPPDSDEASLHERLLAAQAELLDHNARLFESRAAEPDDAYAASLRHVTARFDEAVAEVETHQRRSEVRTRWFVGLLVVVAMLGAGAGAWLVARQFYEFSRTAKALEDSERRLRLVAENAPGVLYLCKHDARFTMLFLGKRVQHLTGYPAEAFLEDRLSITDLFHPDDSRHIFTAVDAALGHREQFHLLYRLRHRTDGWRWIEEWGSGVWDESGELRYLEGVLYDVTSRKFAEDSMRRERDLTTAVLETAGALVIVLDREGKIVRFNRACEKLTGYRREEICGEPFWQRLLTPDESAAVQEVFVKLRRGDIPSEYENDWVTRDGTRRRIAWSNTAIFDDIGRVEFIIGTGIDITERQRAQEEHRRLEQQVQHAQKLESLGILAGGVAHDFNNLLVGILGHAGLAQMELPEGSPARAIVQQIEVAAQRAAELARQMLAYSGKGRFIIEPIDVSKLVQEMAHLLEVSITKKAVLRFDLAANLPLIQADATQLRQVVMNLITNAADALERQSGVIVVRTGLMEADRAYLADTYLDDALQPGYYIFIEVADTGSGMDAETLARIFDPFFTTKFAGRGLGLAVVLGVVRGHRGAIKVTSAPNAGTTFRVLFPCRPDSGGPSAVVGQVDAAMSEQPWRGSGTILVADDEEVVRTVAKLTLERFGFTVLTANDGGHAIDVFRRHADEIRCVLLDLTMPVMSGEEVLLALRGIRTSVPVLLSSGYTEQEALSKVAGDGPTGFVQKPYRPQELIEKVRGILGEG